MEPESLPILEFDSSIDAIIEPKHLYKTTGLSEFAVICFFQDVITKLLEQKDIRILSKNRRSKKLHPISAAGSLPIYELNTVNGSRITVFFPGVGSPIAAAMFEEVIALGCKKFISCGSAGVLDRSIPIGHILVPISAIRDEGISYHYLPPSREVGASPEGVAALEEVLKLHNHDYTLTKTWTIDAIYRETRLKIQRRKSEGCLAVEMEAAALFAVAQFRKVKLAQILYASDDISDNLWDARFWSGSTLIREKLFWIAVEACLRL
jgi:uridine phosphorylase